MPARRRRWRASTSSTSGTTSRPGPAVGSMTSSTGVERFITDGEDRIDAGTVQRLIAREERLFAAANATSRTRYDAARNVLAGGVVSSFQLQEPWPVYLKRGQGAAVWDVDGTRRLDFHNGFGA